MKASTARLLGRPLRLRTILSVLIIAALIPALSLMALAIWRAGAADRDAATAQFLSQARTLGAMFASALDANASMVRATADSADPASGGARLDAVLKLFSAKADQARSPALGAGRWSVSNLFDIEPGVSAKLVLTVGTAGDAAEPGALSLLMDPRELTRALSFNLRNYPDMLVAIVDGNGRVIGRSRDEDRFVGARVPTWDALLATQSSSGTFNATLLEGDAITFAFSTIAGTPGWVVVAGMPSAVLDNRWREPLAALIFGSVLAVTAGLLLALLVAHRVAAPLGALASYAQDSVSNGTAEPPPGTRILEYETLRNSLVKAQSTLLDRADRLAVSEQRYRAIAGIGAMVTWRRRADGTVISLEGWGALTGQTAEDGLGMGWIESIHPDDLARVEANWAEATANGREMDYEIRVARAEGGWKWVRVRAVPVRDSDGRSVEWVGTLEDIDQRKERQLRDSHLALHDELTGLPNRALLRDRLAMAIEQSAQGRFSALLYVDLDHFKRANDTHGHSVGDTLLQLAAERMRSLLRPTDTAARLGGDEFAVLLDGIEGIDAAVAVGTRVVRVLSSIFDVDGIEIRIGASVGIARIEPNDMGDEIIRRADIALYEAKGAGRNRCMVYASAA